MVLCDVGSVNTRLGFAGDYVPKMKMLSYYGRAKHQGVKVGLDANAKYYGDELIYKKHLLRPHAVLSRGIVDDFGDFEEFLRFCIADGLRLDAADA